MIASFCFTYCKDCYLRLIVLGVEVMIPISTLDIGNEDVFHTANILDYIIDLEPFGVMTKCVKSIRFDVKACENTFLILSGSNDQTQPMYEVIISGYDNSYAVIRRRNDDSLTSNSQHWIGVVELLDDQRQSCSSYKSYWLSWETGHLKLGGGAILNSDVIVDGTDTNPFRGEQNLYFLRLGRYSRMEHLFEPCEILGATSPVSTDVPQTHQANWIFYSKCYDDKGMCIGCFF
ncbi:unnamed protein product [Mytilus edulis]|uniref:Farnesoic acid O-methyl transferase domain-containing protein n=1 Tax=Mytilus edulis TaxID=6550 RepID=A0A8S3V2P6_MYTED|nr:unnamed protein product [Mytilus edulis]